MNRVTVTRPIVGICHMQVCAENSATKEEIEQVANEENPSGVGPWALIAQRSTPQDVSFGTTDGPVPCKQYPTDRTHYLLKC